MRASKLDRVLPFIFLMSMTLVIKCPITGSVGSNFSTSKKKLYKSVSSIFSLFSTSCGYYVPASGTTI